MKGLPALPAFPMCPSLWVSYRLSVPHTMFAQVIKKIKEQAGRCFFCLANVSSFPPPVVSPMMSAFKIKEPGEYFPTPGLLCHA